MENISEEKSRAYIDQNILGFILDGTLTLGPQDKFEWIYSSEHFVEIARSDDARLLDALEKIRARIIDIPTNEFGIMQNSATIEPYNNPHQLYENHKDTISKTEFDESLLHTIIARLQGANNVESLSELPEKYCTEVRRLYNEAGVDAEDRIQQLNETLQTLIKQIAPIKSLEEGLRKSIRTNKGRLGTLYGKGIAPEKVIPEIWNIIDPKIDGLTRDHFFGLPPDAPDNLSGNKMYTNIIACHMALNMVGYQPDKGLAKEENSPNILSDGNHLGYAAYCHAFFSGDHRLCAKARVIYGYKNIGSQVLEPVKKEK